MGEGFSDGTIVVGKGSWEDWWGVGENRTDNMIIEIMTERLQIEVMAMQTIRQV